MHACICGMWMCKCVHACSVQVGIHPTERVQTAWNGAGAAKGDGPHRACVLASSCHRFCTARQENLLADCALQERPGRRTFHLILNWTLQSSGVTESNRAASVEPARRIAVPCFSERRFPVVEEGAATQRWIGVPCLPDRHCPAVEEGVAAQRWSAQQEAQEHARCRCGARGEGAGCSRKAAVVV